MTEPEPVRQPNYQLCTAADILPDEPQCRRLAQMEWRPDGPDSHPIFLCNFHGDVFLPLKTEP